MPRTIPRQVGECNRLLAQEMGRLTYEWHWSEDLLIEMRAMHQDGTRKNAFSKTASGLYLASPVYEKRKLLLNTTDQWVLCRMCEPPSKHEWGRLFGTDLQYPNAGLWTPCQTPKGPVALPRGHDPTINDTWELIHLLRAEQRLTPQEVTNDILEQQDKEKAASYELAYQEFRDLQPAFGGVPGWKTHWSAGGVKGTELEPRKDVHEHDNDPSPAA